jgi:hypothetical protein
MKMGSQAGAWEPEKKLTANKKPETENRKTPKLKSDLPSHPITAARESDLEFPLHWRGALSPSLDDPQCPRKILIADVRQSYPEPGLYYRSIPFRR